MADKDDKKDEDKNKDNGMSSNSSKKDDKDKKEEKKKLDENSQKVQNFINWCVQIANDNNPPHLYVWGAAGPTDFDCTGFLSYGLMEAGYDMQPCHGSAFDSGVMSCGWESVDYDDSMGTDPLQPGDILNNDHHVELYVGDGNVCGAHSAHKAEAEQISVEPWFGDGWENIYRFPGISGVSGPNGATVSGGGGGSRNSPFSQGFKGFKYIPHGKSVTIIKLPLGKTPCEPIYPDYVTVGDSAPKWALDKTVEADAQDSAVQSGKAIPDGDSGIEAPNGMHYSSADIKQVMDANPGMSQDDAIKQLSQEEKYTKPVERNENGTFDYVDGGTGGDSSSSSSEDSSSQPSAQGTQDGTSKVPSAEELEKQLEASRKKQESLMQNCNQTQKSILNELLQQVNSVGGAGADAERNAINYLLSHLNVDSTKMLANPEPIEPSSEYPVGVGDANQRLRSAYESASAAIDKLIDADDPTKNK